MNSQEVRLLIHNAGATVNIPPQQEAIINVNEAGKDRHENDPTGEQKLTGPDGPGRDGTIPGSADGVGLGAGTEPNTFEPEEDPDAAAEALEDSEDTPEDTPGPS
jgi:hypothetical protein